jgi:hypothetical protein
MLKCIENSLKIVGKYRGFQDVPQIGMITRFSSGTYNNKKCIYEW